MTSTMTFPVGQKQFDRFITNVTLPWELCDYGLKAQIKIRGVELQLVYAASIQTLFVDILHKPFYVSEERVRKELNEYIQKAQEEI